MVLLVLPLSRSLKWLNLTCVLCIVGIWIEKGMGLVIPGFIPRRSAQIVEYSPSLNETLVCLGIWAFGLLCYTIFLRMSVPILQGRLSKANEEQLAALVFYQLVVVNYGEFASSDDAVTFGAAALGLAEDDYYRTVCELADRLHQ
jgi:hypothetical protein